MGHIVKSNLIGLRDEADWYILVYMISGDVEQWKLEHTIRLYREGQITKARAAEIAGVPLYDMHDIIRQRGIPLHYSLDESREDMRLILERAGLDPQAIG